MSAASRVGSRAGPPLLAFFLMFGFALAGILLTREGGRMASVWMANAVMIAFLLRTARTHWRRP